MVPFTSWRDYKKALIGTKNKISRNRISMQTVKNFSHIYGNKFPDNGPLCFLDLVLRCMS